MRRLVGVIAIALLVMGWGCGRAQADNTAIMKEIQSLKERIEELEQKLEEQEAAARKQTAKTEKAIDEKLGEAFDERFGTLAIHGGAILYYQESRCRRAERC